MRHLMRRVLMISCQRPCYYGGRTFIHEIAHMERCEVGLLPSHRHQPKRSSGEKRQFIDWILQVKCDVGCTKLTFSDHVSLYRRGMNRRGSTRGNDMGATAWINRWMHKLCVRGLLPFLAPLYLLTVVYTPNVVTNPPSHFLVCSGITLLTLSLFGYWQRTHEKNIISHINFGTLGFED